MLECLAVFAIGGLFIGIVLAFEKIQWETIVFTDTTLIVCGLIMLLSVPILCYGFKHKVDALSGEAQESVRWVQFGMMFLLFLGILTCVFRNSGAIAVAAFFVLSAFFLAKILTGKSNDKEELKWYKSKHWDLAALSVAVVPIAWIFIVRFADPTLLEWNISASVLPFSTYLAVANYIQYGRK